MHFIIYLKVKELYFHSSMNINLIICLLFVNDYLCYLCESCMNSKLTICFSANLLQQRNIILVKVKRKRFFARISSLKQNGILVPWIFLSILKGSQKLLSVFVSGTIRKLTLLVIYFAKNSNLFLVDRSCSPEVFCKKDVLKNLV